MNNNYIDLEKITNSIETLSTMENLVNYVDLTDNFEEMEKVLRKINFEHANCLKYKDSLEIIYRDLEQVKRKINDLIDALRKTSSAYNGVELITRKDIKTLADIYQSTPASEKLQKQLEEYRKEQKTVYAASIVQIGADQQNVTVIPPVTTEQQTTNTTSTNNQIDTVPIGVAIGVTGIIGSLGAIAINEKSQMKKKKRKSSPKPSIGGNDFKVQVFKGDTDTSKELDAYDEYFGAPSKDEVSPYQAARMERESDRFYGNQLNDIIPKETDLTLDDDDDDDNDLDDFDD